MKAEEYLNSNSFSNIAIRNKVGVQAYMLSDILDDFAELQIKELKDLLHKSHNRGLTSEKHNNEVKLILKQ